MSRTSATAINRFVGMRIRERRKLLDLTGRELGDRLGCSTQQVHNYELGKNGVSAGMLYEIARALRTSPECFYEGLDKDHPVAQETPRQRIKSDFARSLGEFQSIEHLEAIGQLVRGLTTKPGPKKPRAARKSEGNG